MSWWSKLFRSKIKPPLGDGSYRIAFTLYSKDGRRAAEIREFSNGQTYLLESERVEGTAFRERHGGRLVGPFSSPDRAERFITATEWFVGADA